MTQKIQSIRGFNDVLPADSGLWQHLHDTARGVFEDYGYAEIRLPVVERTDLYKRAVGEVTDVVEKEMYAFEDRGGEHIALRPEFTAGVVRMGVEHGLFHNSQQRVWCTGPVFRYERPQAGRYRQFHQLNVEAYGINGPDVDAELIAMSARLWKKLGFTGLRLEINSLGQAEARARYRAALIEFLQRHESSLDEDSRRRLHSNPLRVLDSKVPTTQAIVVDAPSILDYLDADSAAHFDGLQQGLGDLGVDYVVNPRLVRGLDYYTKGVFEWITTELGAQGTICAGGRYDTLVEQLGGGPTPAVGWASGVERLILLLQAKAAELQIPENGPAIVVCSLGEAAQREAAKLAESLRDRFPGAGVQLSVGGGKLPAQFKRADRSGARYALVLGEAEIAAKQVQVKSLRDASPQETCTWAELPARLESLLSR
ncbi:histidine--tRNA ligase [Hydrocarboniphaga sp.]|uniref:histidine--tRNA ligase n=1 Tax=Hydrocarboniphaga sp. TaxID=2033016 RepID=UPI002AB98458|nr:histidine--tRNA ligase [Hydrocarboniphaga sp.]MDZ4077339.1 histidine--tRNA ligase [Hydrocarboniphaga sp.]